jgi:mannose-6-phosphate isomerase-like protein (cupin superfamily)
MASKGESGLLVQSTAEIEEGGSRGALRVKRVFTAGDVPFASTFQFFLSNRLPAGGKNERHIHDDVEKVYYFTKGSGEVSCGDDTARVTAGDFMFFPAAVEHEILADEDGDLEFIVCAAQTLEGANG